jgi:hypothetical protein
VNGMAQMRFAHGHHEADAPDNDTDELTRLLLGQDAEPQRGLQREEQHAQMHANRQMMNDSFPFSGPFSSVGGQVAPVLHQHSGGILSSDPMGDFRPSGSGGRGYNAAPLGGPRLFERMGAGNSAYPKPAAPQRVQNTVAKAPVPASTASIRGLVALGFDEPRAAEALYLSQNDFNKAYEYLTSQGGLVYVIRKVCSLPRKYTMTVFPSPCRCEGCCLVKRLHVERTRFFLEATRLEKKSAEFFSLHS